MEYTFLLQVSENQYYPETWTEIGYFNKDIGAVREYLREGDCTDMVSNSDGSGWDDTDSMVQAIRSSEALIVTVINFHNHGGYNDELCLIGRNEHWIIWNHTIAEIGITIPTDFGSVVDMFEVQNGIIYNITDQLAFSTAVLGMNIHGSAIKANKVTFSKVRVGPELSTRLFVLANNPEVRKKIQNNL